MSASVHDGIGGVLAVIVVLALLAFLAIVVRFSVVSPLRTRRTRSRLRRPEEDDVGRVVGFLPPDALITMFRHNGWIERLEFELLDTGTPPRVWEIGAFIPLTERDVRQARSLHGVRDGIPIADDGDKGCYVVLRSGAVVLRSPTGPAREVRVASSAREFGDFVAREPATRDS